MSGLGHEILHYTQHMWEVRRDTWTCKMDIAIQVDYLLWSCSFYPL